MTAPVLVALGYALPPEGWLQLGSHAALGGLVYVAVLLAFCLDAGERSDVRRILGRLEAFLPWRRPA